jgi:cellobiose-specific phosphotransferase system component IIC
MNVPTILVPWTIPPILYGLIVTQFDWKSIPISLLSIATLFLVYLPFALIVKKDELKKKIFFFFFFFLFPFIYTSIKYVFK